MSDGPRRLSTGWPVTRVLLRSGLASLLLLAGLLVGCTVAAVPSREPPSGDRTRAPAPPPEARPESGPEDVRPPLRPTWPARTMTPVRHFPEVRGLWVVRSTMTSAQEIREMVDRAASAGFNTLLLQVRGRGDAFYRSRWEPRAETVEGSPGFDPLALAVEEAHARGMAVHAWVNTHLVWGMGALPRSPDHLVNAHPDWLGVQEELGRELFSVDPSEPRFLAALHSWTEAHAETVEGLYSSPSHPAVKERVYSVWMDLVERYDLDGIHFDYVRFPSTAFDYSRGALSRFRDWVAPRLSPDRLVELDRASARDPYAFVEALPGPWGEFRRAQITELVERIYHGVKARRPEMIVSAAVFSNQEDAWLHRYQDWTEWLERGILDVAVPMAYTSDPETYRSQIRAARSAAGRRERLWGGVGAYLNGAEGTLEKIDIARSEGAGGVVLFSYDWAVTEGSRTGSVPFLRRVGAAAFGDAR